MGKLSSTEELLNDTFERLNRVHRSIITTPGSKGSAQKKWWDARLDDAYQGVWSLATDARPASLAWLVAHRQGSVILIRQAIQAGFEFNLFFTTGLNQHVIEVDLNEARNFVSKLEHDLSRYDSYAGLLDEHFQILQKITTVESFEPLALARDEYLTALSQPTLEAYTDAVSDAFSDERIYYLELPNELKRHMLARASTVFEQLTVGTLVYQLVNGETDE